ncbi:hypothetical protein DFJ63DRAFT_335497 [Scheffersomyces coipomensis]|uniref:uncharacterized protein n=1 Tax=Scheffersomyces coipomensis TaxID=1788519 RepID=UPI00315D28C9
MSYPAFVDGKPPVITLSEYDGADWAEKVVAIINESDNEVLDKIFRSAHNTHAQQQSQAK